MGRAKYFLPAVLLLAAVLWAGEEPSGQPFRAGACAMDVSPTSFPVVINGGFLAGSAGKVSDPLHVRWLVLDDGATRLALGVLDTCLIPAEFADAVKVRAREVTGIPPERIMLSATHTHSAPSLMQALGTPPDPHYADFALPRIVEGLKRAVDQLAPAQVGWTSFQAPEHTHTRVWIRRPDKMFADPFGKVTVRAHMHPGHQSPDVVGPSGPSDPECTLLAVRSAEGKPIAVLASYAMHYFGAPAVSADYFGVFAGKLGPLVGAGDSGPAFVGIMAQGTSGDQQWMDYGRPRPALNRETYAGQLAQMTADACKTITFQERVPLAMRETTLQLATRQPDDQRLAWARELVAKKGDRLPKSQAEVYACEQLWLKEHPVRNVKLQALRIGDLGVAIWPCEVFALSGLQVKAQSPFQRTMNIALANAEEGYIPPPELYPLGGYNTWPCRSAGLEVEAAPKIVEASVRLLEEVSGERRREARVSHGPYAKDVLEARPLAYWRMDEWSGPVAVDATGSGRNAAYEPGIARWLDGPVAPAFSGDGVVNRCVHLAGGRVSAEVKELKACYTAEFWFWNGVSNNWRGVTGILLSRGTDTLAIGGTSGTPGRLLFGTLAGRTSIEPKTWNHVVLVRDGSRVAVYLNGGPEPEISGEAAPDASQRLFLGGADGRTETFEGKIDEVALYDRALGLDEIRRRFRLAVPDNR